MSSAIVSYLRAQLRTFVSYPRRPSYVHMAFLSESPMNYAFHEIIISQNVGQWIREKMFPCKNLVAKSLRND